VVAVLPFRKEGRDFEPAVSRYVGPRIIEKLLKAGVRVLERAELDRVMEELEKQMSDLFSAEAQAKAGQMAGADAVVLGTVRDEGLSAYELEVKLVDIATGEILATTRASLNRADLPVSYGGH
jgi:curli biogenesis system outer membrane secretion channel CsgG